MAAETYAVGGLAQTLGTTLLSRRGRVGRGWAELARVVRPVRRRSAELARVELLLRAERAATWSGCTDPARGGKRLPDVEQLEPANDVLPIGGRSS